MKDIYMKIILIFLCFAFFSTHAFAIDDDTNLKFLKSEDIQKHHQFSKIPHKERKKRKKELREQADKEWNEYVSRGCLDEKNWGNGICPSHGSTAKQGDNR